MPEKLIVRNTQAPGDYIVLSSALRDLKRAYPELYDLHVYVHQPDVFRHNPNVKIAGKGHRGRKVVAKYNDRRARFGIHKSNQFKAHFMWAMLAGLNHSLGLNAHLTEFKPDLHLTQEEMANPLIRTDKPYWVFVSGGKKDYTAKIWLKERWQEVVNALKDRVTMVQVGGGSHMHPPIAGVYDLVKKTSFRQLMQLIYHSQGVICIVTCLMHIAAAFNKPCVVIGGGREPWWWEAYDEENRLQNMRLGIPDWKPPANDNFIPHRFIHTMNMLKCCTNKGCWRSRVGKNGKLCYDQVFEHGVYLPKCLDMITAERVIDEWKWYFENGICKLGSSLTLPVTAPTTPTPELERKLEPARGRIEVVDSVFLAVYAEGRVDGISELKAYADKAKTGMTVFYNGTDTALAASCSKHGIPLHMAHDRPGRAELMRRAIHLADGDVFVWLEAGVTFMRKDWLHALAHGMNGSARGVVRWTRANAQQLELVKSAPWFKGVALHKFSFDLSTCKLYHFDRGLFAAPKSVLQDMDWPDKRLPDAELDALFGEALRQQGIELMNVGDVIE